MKRNPYYTWLRERTSRHNFALKTEAGVRPAATNAQIAEFFQTGQYTVTTGRYVWRKRHLPRLSNGDYGGHTAGLGTLYFQGEGRAGFAETLVMIDIDCQKSRGLGSPAGAREFAEHLEREFFPGLYSEPSTNGAGVHAYLVLRKPGLPAKTVNAQLKTFEKWLKWEADRAGADIEGVEVKGSCPVYEFRDKKVVKIKSGTNAKLPRGDVRGTTHIEIADLAKLVPAEETVLEVRQRPTVAISASWCPRAVTLNDLADMPELRELAVRLGVPGEKCGGRVVVTAEDVAIFLLVLRFLTKNMNDDGSLPWARFEALWVRSTGPATCGVPSIRGGLPQSGTTSPRWKLTGVRCWTGRTRRTAWAGPASGGRRKR